MKKTAILLVCMVLLAATFAACVQDTGTPVSVSPVTEATTIADKAFEFSTEAALQATEGESAAQTEAAASFSAGKTALQAAPVVYVSPTTPSTAAKTQAAPATAAPANVLISKAGTTRPANTAANTAALLTASPAATNTPYVAPTTTTTTAATTTTTTRPASTSTTLSTSTTTTTRQTTTTTTAAPTTTKAASDYEAMGQATYQAKVIEALNALRKGNGLAPMALSEELSASTMAQAQKMAAAGKSFHTEGIPPGFESVAKVPYDFPAQVLGEMLTNHVQNFLLDGYSNVGIAVVRNGNTLYAVMQGN